MEKDVLKDLGMSSRDEVIRFLKSLWTEQPADCPKCGGKLDYMHKKAKKSNCDWKCTNCNKIYKTINILNKLNDKRI